MLKAGIVGLPNVGNTRSEDARSAMAIAMTIMAIELSGMVFTGERRRAGTHPSCMMVSGPVTSNFPCAMGIDQTGSALHISKRATHVAGLHRSDS